MVKNLPAMQESQVQSLGREDPWKRERLPTPVFLLKELWGQRSLAGCRPWDHKESDMTEWLSFSLYLLNLKEALQGFSLAYLYCQPHYSYALQPLLKKKKKRQVIWTQALWYHNTQQYIWLPKNIGVGCLSLLQRIFTTQEFNWGLLHCRWILYQLSNQ